MPHTIVFKASAARRLRQLPRDIQARIGRRIDALAADPYPPQAIKLSGRDSIWRIRSGDYRILYSVEDEVLRVLILDIGHRRDIYRTP